MQYVWRNNEDGASCPNHWAGTATTEPPTPRFVRKGGVGSGTGPMNLTSIVFFYAWPSSSS